jgi:hypothetical protein
VAGWRGVCVVLVGLVCVEREEDRGSEDGPRARTGQDQSPDRGAAAADQLKRKTQKKTKGGQRQDRANSGSLEVRQRANSPRFHSPFGRRRRPRNSRAKHSLGFLCSFFWRVVSQTNVVAQRIQQMADESPLKLLKWAGRPDARRAKGEEPTGFRMWLRRAGTRYGLVVLGATVPQLLLVVAGVVLDVV